MSRVEKGPGTKPKVHFRVRVRLPKAPYPPSADHVSRLLVHALPARGNTPPQLKLDIAERGPDGNVGTHQEFPDRSPAFSVGTALVVSADRTADAEGDRLLAWLWTVMGPDGSKRQLSGSTMALRLDQLGRYELTVEVSDEAGERSSRQVSLISQSQGTQLRGCNGGCATCDNVLDRNSEYASLIGLAFLGCFLWLWRFARRP